MAHPYLTWIFAQTIRLVLGIVHVYAIAELIHVYLLTVLFNFIIVCHIDPCLSKECPIGSSCKIYQVTGEAYCEQSCELESGGCQSHQKCELVNVTCARAPCPPVVNCRGNCKMVNHVKLDYRNVKTTNYIIYLFHQYKTWYFHRGVQWQYSLWKQNLLWGQQVCHHRNSTGVLWNWPVRGFLQGWHRPTFYSQRHMCSIWLSRSASRHCQFIQSLIALMWAVCIFLN